jgi:hypothetical protein
LAYHDRWWSIVRFRLGLCVQRRRPVQRQILPQGEGIPAASSLENGQPVAVRARGASLVPYIHIDINLADENGIQASKPISEVVVGPGVDQVGQVAVVHDLLQTGGYPDARVKRSKTPYRA